MDVLKDAYHTISEVGGFVFGLTMMIIIGALIFALIFGNND